LKKVLIIGGTGFLGSHLCNFLHNKKFEIDVLSRNKIEKKLKRINYYYADIGNKKQIKRKLKNNQYNFIFNFGGNINHKDKRQVIKSHYIGLKNLLDIF